MTADSISATGSCAKGHTPQTAGTLNALLLSGVGDSSSLPLAPVVSAAGVKGAS